MLQEFKSGRITPRELIRLAFGVYRENFKYIFIIGLIVYIPTSVVLTLSVSGLDLYAIYTTGDLSSSLRFLAVMLALTIAVMPLETAALTYFVKQKLDNANANLEGALAASFGNWGKLFVTALLYVIIILMSSFLIFPMVILFISFYFYASIIVVDNSMGITALKQSFNIVKGRWWRTFGTVFVIGIVEVAFQNVFSSMLYALLGSGFALPGVNILLGLAISVITSILSIVFSIAITLYFFNLYYTAERTAAEVSVR